jgi:hypothetical protein
MYNTQFKVKYNDIENELLDKMNNEKKEEEYTKQDVLDICSKLYRDELLSVFGAEDLMDDNFDSGMKYVYEIMIQNECFKQIICNMEKFYTKELYKNKELTVEQNDCLKQIILISLFSQHIFHITHKCICQQIETGTIDDTLLLEINKRFVDLLV